MELIVSLGILGIVSAMIGIILKNGLVINQFTKDRNDLQSDLNYSLTVLSSDIKKAQEIKDPTNGANSIFSQVTTGKEAEYKDFEPLLYLKQISSNGSSSGNQGDWNMYLYAFDTDNNGLYRLKLQYVDNSLKYKLHEKAAGTVDIVPISLADAYYLYNSGNRIMNTALSGNIYNDTSTNTLVDLTDVYNAVYTNHDPDPAIVAADPYNNKPQFTVNFTKGMDQMPVNFNPNSTYNDEESTSTGVGTPPYYTFLYKMNRDIFLCLYQNKPFSVNALGYEEHYCTTRLDVVSPAMKIVATQLIVDGLSQKPTIVQSSTDSSYEFKIAKQGKTNKERVIDSNISVSNFRGDVDEN